MTTPSRRGREARLASTASPEETKKLFEVASELAAPRRPRREDGKRVLAAARATGWHTPAIHAGITVAVAHDIDEIMADPEIAAQAAASGDTPAVLRERLLRESQDPETVTAALRLVRPDVDTVDRAAALIGAYATDHDDGTVARRAYHAAAAWSPATAARMVRGVVAASGGAIPHELGRWIARDGHPAVVVAAVAAHHSAGATVDYEAMERFSMRLAAAVFDDGHPMVVDGDDAAKLWRVAANVRAWSACVDPVGDPPAPTPAAGFAQAVISFAADAPLATIRAAADVLAEFGDPHPELVVAAAEATDRLVAAAGDRVLDVDDVEEWMADPSVKAASDLRFASDPASAHPAIRLLRRGVTAEAACRLAEYAPRETAAAVPAPLAASDGRLAELVVVDAPERIVDDPDVAAAAPPEALRRASPTGLVNLLRVGVDPVQVADHAHPRDLADALSRCSTGSPGAAWEVSYAAARRVVEVLADADAAAVAANSPIETIGRLERTAAALRD